MSYLFYPASKLINCPKGFNQIPIVKDDENPEIARADLNMTPFVDYEKTVISISDPQFIDSAKVLELKSYVLLAHEDSWLAIEDSGITQIGLLPNTVNRGLESHEISVSFNSIKLNEPDGKRSLAVIGYIVTDTEIIFLLRLRFQNIPLFLSRKKKFVSISPEDFFKKKTYKKLSPTSSAILDYMDEIFGNDQ